MRSSNRSTSCETINRKRLRRDSSIVQLAVALPSTRAAKPALPGQACRSIPTVDSKPSQPPRKRKRLSRKERWAKMKATIASQLSSSANPQQLLNDIRDPKGDTICLSKELLRESLISIVSDIFDNAEKTLGTRPVGSEPTPSIRKAPPRPPPNPEPQKYPPKAKPKPTLRLKSKEVVTPKGSPASAIKYKLTIDPPGTDPRPQSLVRSPRPIVENLSPAKQDQEESDEREGCRTPIPEEVLETPWVRLKELSSAECRSPIRPLSGYNVFDMEQRAKFQEMNKKYNSVQVTKNIAAQWRELSKKDKEPYEDVSKIDKEYYMRELQTQRRRLDTQRQFGLGDLASVIPEVLAQVSKRKMARNRPRRKPVPKKPEAVKSKLKPASTKTQNEAKLQKFAAAKPPTTKLGKQHHATETALFARTTKVAVSSNMVSHPMALSTAAVADCNQQQPRNDSSAPYVAAVANPNATYNDEETQPMCPIQQGLIQGCSSIVRKMMRESYHREPRYVTCATTEGVLLGLMIVFFPLYTSPAELHMFLHSPLNAVHLIEDKYWQWNFSSEGKVSLAEVAFDSKRQEVLPKRPPFALKPADIVLGDKWGEQSLFVIIAHYRIHKGKTFEMAIRYVAPTVDHSARFLLPFFPDTFCLPQ